MKRRNYFKTYFSILTIAIGVTSCTDLEIEETDSFIDEGFQGLENTDSAIEQLYQDVFDDLTSQENHYALREVTTDMLLVPTRGADWGDNGRWRKLHQHEWGLEEGDIIRPFDNWNANQLLASQILDERSNASPLVTAEARFLRAFSMWMILDFYGQVPFRDTQLPSTAIPTVLTGEDAVNFILADLDAAITGLPPIGAGSIDDLQNASKSAARYLKAKFLLNKHIYINQLTGGGGTPDSNDMQEVITLVDAIIDDGFALESDYFEIFKETSDTETIWWGKSDIGNRIFNTLHYNSTGLEGGGWNGFSTLAEFYDLFEGNSDSNRVTLEGAPLDNQELRRGGVPPGGLPFTGRPGTSDEGGFENGSNVGLGFLIGPQFDLDGSQLTDRQGNPLSFTRDFVDNDGNPSLINNNEQTGIRILKHNPGFGARLNHRVYFRFADAFLMKAEAMMRSNEDPTSMVNTLRTIRGATPLASVTEQDLLDERGRELYTEGWRRNDLIRFGQFLRQWEFKGDTETGNTTRLLFPIPLPQLLANPNLVQNPGY